MKLALYQIDAFANNAFEGNPAAVVPLDQWLPDDVMHSIAEENNLSETVFFVESEKGYDIRWFTPVAEVDLCGHATLACAEVIFNTLGYEKEQIVFDSRSGLLSVARESDWLTMDFPCQAPQACEVPAAVKEAFAIQPIACLKREDYIVVFENEADVLSAEPEFSALAELDLRGVAITSTSSQYDFISRFFAPKYGINEDPVTGSAFTQLVPYWADILKKQDFFAKQVSGRGGEVRCSLSGERVKISGKAVQYLHGTIEI